MELSGNKYRKGLTARESFLLSSLSRKDKSIFTIEDVKRLIKHDYKKLTHSLIKKKWILPLKKGLYAIVPLDIGVEGAESFIIHEFVVASHLAKPYYIAYWSALNYHGLSDQIPKSTFIAATVKKMPLTVLYSNFVFVKISKKKFFGFEKAEIDGKKVNLSNINKTIADCLDHPEHAGGIEEVARAIYLNHNELDFKKIIGYAKRMGNLTILKRLGYILEKTGLEEYKLLKDIRLSKGYGLLDTLALKRGTYNEKWKLLINAKIDAKRWIY